MKFLTTTLRPFKAVYIVLFLLPVAALAQTDLASPYSSFGLGRLYQRQTVAQAGMGGAGIALIDPYELNLLNPAAAAFQLEPIFQINGVVANTNYSDSETSFQARSFDFNNISLNFPIKRNVWGLSLGLTPYTNIGYDVNSIETVSGDEQNFSTRYYGEGGINQAYLGTGYKLFSKVDTLGNITALSAGATMNYNFGNINSVRELVPTDPEGSSLNLRTEENIVVNDISFEFGLHYQANIIKKVEKQPRYLKFLAGVTYSLGNDLNAKRSSLSYTYRSSPLSEIGIIKDTVLNTEPIKGSLYLPQRMRVGVGFDFVGNRRQRLRFAADYATQNWSEYVEQFSGEKVTLGEYTNSEIYSAGLEYTPNVASLEFFERINYRAGVRYEKTNLSIESEQIDDYGISFGLSLPVNFRRNLTRSTFNLGAEYGKYGSTNNNLIEEEYMRLYFGFTFTPHYRNVWFVKPKYD